MNTMTDWTLWRSFAAVAEHGSLSKAARALGSSQPTIGRHIEALEFTLGTKLFERGVAGLTPTELGLAAYEPIRRAVEAIAEAELHVAGTSSELSGSVRITASVIIAHYVLPRMLRVLRIEFPAIDFEIVPTDSAGNLLLREADIAVRMFRPTQGDLITRKLGETAIVACAHQGYLKRRGTPRTVEDLLEHDLIGFDRSELLIAAAQRLGFNLKRSDFAFRCDSQSATWEMMRAGLGIGFAQANIIRQTDGMMPIALNLAIPPLEVWLTCHRELHTARRIRAVYDRLGELMGNWLKKSARRNAANANSRSG
ncbi:LysR family transcriptional regulator [Pelagibacterium sp. 26DY04]|uniref:LysR family transcriptional regulator n=1 Tax=Pelagibacterium sp. 26DY04 TaxID=2967130 RepID=UPI002814E949|nr:LysR family transcriptional regulator [Pelagibacterium sp. 26DY04]WMT86691.1 LysR family transcriptional regulator [Pelagibacterium sp. 26DY04]